jgi:hypothetical protein
LDDMGYFIGIMDEAVGVVLFGSRVGALRKI